jgi:hypothetical protein
LKGKYKIWPPDDISSYFYSQIKKMTKTIIFLIMLQQGVLQAQEMIGKSRTEVKDHALKNAVARLIETDSTIGWTAVHTETPAEYLYSFDKSGRCRMEKFSTTSDKYYQEAFSALLKKRKYRWKNINLNQFVSKFSKGLLLELQMIDSIYSISIIKTGMDKTLYRLLLGKK